MKIFRLIMLQETDRNKLIFDFNTKKYYRTDLTNVKDYSFVTPLVIPLLVNGMEILCDLIGDMDRLAGGLIMLASLVMVTMLVIEFFLAQYGEKCLKTATEVQYLNPSIFEKDSYEKRFGNAMRLSVILSSVFMAVCVIYILTGVTIVAGIASFVFAIEYLILASARPFLLRRFAKEYCK